MKSSAFENQEENYCARIFEYAIFLHYRLICILSQFFHELKLKTFVFFYIFRYVRSTV